MSAPQDSIQAETLLFARCVRLVTSAPQMQPVCLYPARLACMQHLELIPARHARQVHLVVSPRHHLSYAQLEPSVSVTKQAARLVQRVTSAHRSVRLLLHLALPTRTHPVILLNVSRVLLDPSVDLPISPLARLGPTVWATHLASFVQLDHAVPLCFKLLYRVLWGLILLQDQFPARCAPQDINVHSPTCYLNHVLRVHTLLAI